MRLSTIITNILFTYSIIYYTQLLSRYRNRIKVLHPTVTELPSSLNFKMFLKYIKSKRGSNRWVDESLCRISKTT